VSYTVATTVGFTILNTGSGNDAVYVQATGSGGLFVVGDGGTDTVTLGSQASATTLTGSGVNTLAGLQGAVSVAQAGGLVAVFVDDSGDSTSPSRLGATP
jgi:hypothetical protein